jgi:hypothetical protein
VLSLGGRLGGQPRWVTAAMVESLDAEGSTRDGASADGRRHRQVMAVEGTSGGSGAPWGGGGGPCGAASKSPDAGGSARDGASTGGLSGSRR